MKLSKIKEHLSKLRTINFKLPNGNLVPPHFHITEIGKITKHFIDCGGVLRKEERVNFQLWNANDYNHRLHPEKLIQIIELAEKTLNLKDYEIEIEYQSETIGKYNLDFDGASFLLRSTVTTCLAEDECGINNETKPKIHLSDIKNQNVCCDPSDMCC